MLGGDFNKMFIVVVTKNDMYLAKTETLTSGSTNVNQIKFKFNESWAGLDRTAVFKAGKQQTSVILGDDNVCNIPWNTLLIPNIMLSVGVYGSQGNEIVLPTVWASLGKIKEGVTLGSEPSEIPDNLYNQILEKITGVSNKTDTLEDRINTIEENLPVPMSADELRAILTGEVPENPENPENPDESETPKEPDESGKEPEEKPEIPEIGEGEVTPGDDDW